MKTIVKLVIAIVLVALCSNVSAQNLKVAHINIQELITAMPEYDSAMVKLQKYGQELQKVIEEMQVELNRKYEDFSKNQANLNDLVRQARTEEITIMQQRLQAFQQQAEENYGQEQEKLVQPVVEKANKAIEAVAKEQNITYVFSSSPQIIHYKAVGTIDLLPAAKQHLGIKK
jgi:outer membrane protein